MANSEEVPSTCLKIDSIGTRSLHRSRIHFDDTFLLLRPLCRSCLEMNGAKQLGLFIYVSDRQVQDRIWLVYLVCSSSIGLVALGGV